MTNRIKDLTIDPQLSVSKRVNQGSERFSCEFLSSFPSSCLSFLGNNPSPNPAHLSTRGMKVNEVEVGVENKVEEVQTEEPNTQVEVV